MLKRATRFGRRSSKIIEEPDIEVIDQAKLGDGLINSAAFLFVKGRTDGQIFGLRRSGFLLA